MARRARLGLTPGMLSRASWHGQRASILRAWSKPTTPSTTNASPTSKQITDMAWLPALLHSETWMSGGRVCV